MENQIILLDTSILIDYYRKKDKSKSILYKLTKECTSFAVSTVTHYEIYLGATPDQVAFWDDFFNKLKLPPFDIEVSTTAINISGVLKKINKQIEVPDLFIAATAVTHHLPCSTLNKKHFNRIKELEIVDV